MSETRGGRVPALGVPVCRCMAQVSPAGSSLREPPGQRYAARCARRSETCVKFGICLSERHCSKDN
ncbi:hypothetical protein PGTUg99_024609 [Puccinia graminis f. sp. tritici]|uniref:Uncharacterized protein n=1 Tax=Puccinia graminis f. sp. tritici TaxID=56615 RepID=A0A5B0S7E9_PUCGR|nr:hypothetical protein PGTUg99_024609 [Puccinia graminis f. sp. tritici]